MMLGFMPLSTLLLHSLPPLYPSEPAKEYSWCCSGAVCQRPLHFYSLTCSPSNNHIGWVSPARACSRCKVAAVLPTCSFTRSSLAVFPSYRLGEPAKSCSCCEVAVVLSTSPSLAVFPSNRLGEPCEGLFLLLDGSCDLIRSAAQRKAVADDDFADQLDDDDDPHALSSEVRGAGDVLFRAWTGYLPWSGVVLAEHWPSWTMVMTPMPSALR